MDEMFENLQEAFVDFLSEWAAPADREAPDFLDRATEAGLGFAQRYIDQVQVHWNIREFVNEVADFDLEFGFLDPKTFEWKC
jgi:hypothetical protein